jgi:hypothetical protein
MAANTAVALTSLDFDTLKTNFKDYLRTQSKFQDVDFEGSNISVLMDILAYNTYLNSFYTNMVASEMFIDTAQRRDSIISHAKSLNYTPRSFRSASARINIQVTPAQTTNSVVIPKGTSFTSKVGSNTFTFTTADTRIITSPTNTFVAANVAIYEGPYITESFVVDYSIDNQRFVINSELVDTESVTVEVVEDSGTSRLPYIVGTSLFGLTSTSQVCFIQPARQDRYEILFGNGSIGRRPQNGSVINVSYRVTSGELGNGASAFSPDSTIDGHANIQITTVATASGGAINEDTESIRFNAPRFFQTQERAVTSTDYKALLFARFPEITAVNVFGGENAVPPRYGKVMISVDVADADGTPEYKRTEYLQYIRERCSLSIDPVFVDPVFLYIDVIASVRYNALVTTLSQQDIETLAVNAIMSYSDDQLDNFSVNLRSSKISSAIDDSNPAILSNDVIVRPYILVTPSTGTSLRREIDFGNALRPYVLTTSPSHINEQAVTSTYFTYQEVDKAIIVDNGAGVLQIAYPTSTGVTILKDNIGTVDYNTGRVNITDLLVSSFEGNGIKLYITPLNGDVTAKNNLIMKINPSDLRITVIPERI